QPTNTNRKKWIVAALDVTGKLVLCIQLLIFAWFTGAIERNEQSLYVWIEYSRSVRRFGTADGLLGVFLYLLYYCFVIEVSAFILWRLFLSEGRTEKTRVHEVVLCSCWVLFTFLTFGD